MFRTDLLWQRIDRQGDNDCWLWTGNRTHDGYGLFTWKIDGKSVGRGPHRLIYQQLAGPIPDGLTLDHLCRNRLCCNPKHLEPCGRGENARRGDTGQWKRDKTHCPKGHPYEGRNLMVTKRGHRQCRQCSYANNARGRVRRKSHEVPD